MSECYHYQTDDIVSEKCLCKIQVGSGSRKEMECKQREAQIKEKEKAAQLVTDNANKKS